MARSLPKVCPFLVTVDLKLKWPELPRGPNYPALPYMVTLSRGSLPVANYTRTYVTDTDFRIPVPPKSLTTPWPLFSDWIEPRVNRAPCITTVGGCGGRQAAGYSYLRRWLRLLYRMYCCQVPLIPTGESVAKYDNTGSVLTRAIRNCVQLFRYNRFLLENI